MHHRGPEEVGEAAELPPLSLEQVCVAGGLLVEPLPLSCREPFGSHRVDPIAPPTDGGFHPGQRWLVGPCSDRRDGEEQGRDETDQRGETTEHETLAGSERPGGFSISRAGFRVPIRR